jgi:hypothetical protein
MTLGRINVALRGITGVDSREGIRRLVKGGRTSHRHKEDSTMANYLLVYHGGSAPESPEEGERAMKAWTDWLGGLGDAVVDGGNPVGPGRTIGSDGSVGNGGLNPATGYSILRADSFDAALAAAKGCPILIGPGAGSIGVAEVLPM